MIIAGISFLGFNLTQNIGLWKRLNCFDDTVKLFYNITSKNLDTIINLSSEKYKNVITKFKEILLNSKETLDEIKKLYEILAKYNIKRNINSDETFEDLLKTVIIEFEENNEIKNIFNKIINE